MLGLLLVSRPPDSDYCGLRSVRTELVRIESGGADGVDSDRSRSHGGVERHSLHPLAKALVGAAQARLLPMLPVSDVVEVAGRGIEARVNGHLVGVHGAASPYGEMRAVCEVDGHPAANWLTRPHEQVGTWR